MTARSPRTAAEIARYLERLTAYVRNLGADVPNPTLRSVGGHLLDFRLIVALPGAPESSATLVLQEQWATIDTRRGYARSAYTYELIERDPGRRRAFHMHDVEAFRPFDTVVHEHCEESLGRATCAHYHGIPVADGFDALERLLIAWTDPGPLGCSDLRCIE